MSSCETALVSGPMFIVAGFLQRGSILVSREVGCQDCSGVRGNRLVLGDLERYRLGLAFPRNGQDDVGSGSRP